MSSNQRRQTLNAANFLTTPIPIGSATRSANSSPLGTPGYAESLSPSEKNLIDSLSPGEKALNGIGHDTHEQSYLGGGNTGRQGRYAARSSERRNVAPVPPPPRAQPRGARNNAQYHNHSTTPPKRNRGKRIFWILFLIAALALALGLGLHYGLKKRTPNDGHHRKALNLPSMGLTTDSQGMSEAGSFYTSSDYSNSKIFSWSKGGFDLRDGDAASTDLSINLTETHQPMEGFGAGFTDSSCWLLNQLKGNNNTDYDDIMDYFFNNRTGMSAIRVPIGASDYSNQGEYTYADVKGSSGNSSTSTVYKFNGTYTQDLDSFSLDTAQDYILPVLRDAFQRNRAMRIWLSAWSAPAWMKTTNSTNGGQLVGGSEALYAEYLTRTVVEYTRQGVRPTTLTIMNEPSRGTEGYPSTWMSPQQQAVVASFLRLKLNQVGFDDIEIFGLDDNWSGFQSALDQLSFNTAAASNSNLTTGLTGIAWHCYNGSPSDLDTFQTGVNTNANITNKSIPQHLTECTTTDDSKNQWYSLQFWSKNMFFGMVNRDIRSVITWNVVLDKDHKPYIKTAPCHDCLGTFEISSPSHFQDPSLRAWNVQSTLVYHFASATSNLKRLGGGQAYRVSSAFTSNVDKKVQSCISQFTTFAAPWNGTQLQNSVDKRIGLVAQNDCSGDVIVDIGVQPDNKVGTFKFRPGLTSLVFVS
ncbi:unnamed protein product [Sympodiomycopsis kandeliae]